MTGDAEIRLAAATDEHAGALAEFYHTAWGTKTTPDAVTRSRAKSAATNLAEPGVPPPTFLALQGERIIGYLGSIPARYWNGTAELPGYWLKGLMVLPEFRGGPIGFLVLKETVKKLPRTAVLTVAPAARRLFSALGFKDIGVVPNHMRVIRGGRVLARLDLERLGIERGPLFLRSLLPVAQRTGLATVGGAMLGTGLRLVAALGRPRSAGRWSERSGFPDAIELDDLWRRGRQSVGASPVRDGAEFAYRYREESGGEEAPYSIVTVGTSSRVAGIAAVREPRTDGDPRLNGIALSVVSDLWFDPAEPGAGLALLGQVERVGRRIGADALLVSNGHHAQIPLLRRQGYVGAGGNMHLMVRDATTTETEWPRDIHSWWISRRDASSDEVF